MRKPSSDSQKGYRPPINSEALSAPHSADRLLDKVPDDVLENVIYFYQPVAEYRNTFGILRAAAPVDAMRVCRRWNQVIITNPRFWTDVFVQDDVDVDVIELQLQRSGQCLPLRLWVTSGALTKTTALDAILPYANRMSGLFLEPLPLVSAKDLQTINRSATFASQVKLTDVEKWIGMPLPNLRDLHLGGLTVDGQPPTIEISLPKLEKLSFGMTVPRFFFPKSWLRYLGFINSLVTMAKLSEYLMHCQETLETLNLDTVTVTDLDAPGEGLRNLVMPHISEVVIRIPGGDGLAELLLTEVHYPELRSLTFSASPGRRFGAWHRPPDGGIHLPKLDVLDFDGSIMPIGAFRDILEGTRSMGKLIMPRFGSEEQLSAAIDALVGWARREGNDAESLEELVTADLSARDLARIVEALPAVRNLDVFIASKTKVR
ncbi:hypothetical protein FS837_006692 [Tulasnella sp. UAMH 9824]|nr:hypothetical protein FS837_006692 [Tulasnella sp. UAMH 9824]